MRNLPNLCLSIHPSVEAHRSLVAIARFESIEEGIRKPEVSVDEAERAKKSVISCWCSMWIRSTSEEASEGTIPKSVADRIVSENDLELNPTMADNLLELCQSDAVKNVLQRASELQLPDATLYTKIDAISRPDRSVEFIPIHGTNQA